MYPCQHAIPEQAFQLPPAACMQMDSTQLGLSCYVDPFENRTIGLVSKDGKTAPHWSNLSCACVC